MILVVARQRDPRGRRSLARSPNITHFDRKGNIAQNITHQHCPAYHRATLPKISPSNMPNISQSNITQIVSKTWHRHWTVVPLKILCKSFKANNYFDKKRLPSNIARNITQNIARINTKSANKNQAFWGNFLLIFKLNPFVYLLLSPSKFNWYVCIFFFWLTLKFNYFSLLNFASIFSLKIENTYFGKIGFLYTPLYVFQQTYLKNDIIFKCKLSWCLRILL